MPRSLERLAAGCLALVLAPLFARAEAPAVERLVDRTSRQVNAYLEQVSNVTCTEHVTQLKLGRNGKVQASEQADYNYLILLQGAADDLLLSESRLPQDPARKPRNSVSLLMTNGFSTLFLIFHPYYRASFQFEEAGQELVDGRRLTRLRFTPIPGARTPVALALRGREYPLALQGDAWLDEDTGLVARIQATLANDLRDIGLRSLRADISYANVRLPAWPRAYPLPAEAVIEVETQRQHWRNTHRFDAYKSFMVDTQQAVADDALGQPPAAKVPAKRKKK